MLPLLAAVVLGQSPYVQVSLPNPGGGPSRLMYYEYENRLPTPKLSPKKFDGRPWEFDWMVPAFVRRHPSENELGRVRVYSQQRKEENDDAAQVARAMLRMLDYNLFHLGLDHNPRINDGIIDVYLCWGGKAGGEQMIGEDILEGRPLKVNTIYIYDLATFTDPVERLREVAHEYGHATLPPVGGFKEPEDWANGYLGERIHLRNLRNEIAAKRLDPADAMGVPLPALDAWVKANVDPIVTLAATKGPDLDLTGKGKAGMDAYMGVNLYIESLFPGRTFTRSMVLAGSAKPEDYPSGLMLALEETANTRLNIPAYLRGKSIWIPVGKGTVSGASIAKRKSGWVQVVPGPGPITYISPN